MSKKNIILYGAFDRYNFGDNLMPIVLEEYFKRHKLDLQYEFKFASIAQSDLELYGCKKTISINSILDKNTQDTILIVVGGEVLGASLGTLFIHVQESLFFVQLLRLLNRFSSKTVTFISKLFYSCKWDYPYIPGKDHYFGKVIFNTIGGCAPEHKITNLKNSVFISARDERTFKHLLKNNINAQLIPDSVLMISDLYDRNKLMDMVEYDFVKKFLKSKYIVIQVCPYKAPCSVDELAEEIREFYINHPDYKVVLLPIGYASGHDDVIFLRKLNQKVSDITELYYELNVWEILFIIANANAFYGTSLHGVITAMSYNVPYFSINGKIEKITSFLKTWSVPPFDIPIEYNAISSSFDIAKKFDIDIFKINSRVKINLIKSSIDQMISMF